MGVAVAGAALSPAACAARVSRVHACACDGAERGEGSGVKGGSENLDVSRARAQNSPVIIVLASPAAVGRCHLGGQPLPVRAVRVHVRSPLITSKTSPTSNRMRSGRLSTHVAHRAGQRGGEGRTTDTPRLLRRTVMKPRSPLVAFKSLLTRTPWSACLSSGNRIERPDMGLAAAVDGCDLARAVSYLSTCSKLSVG